jgi:hypothetical protein
MHWHAIRQLTNRACFLAAPSGRYITNTYANFAPPAPEPRRRAPGNRRLAKQRARMKPTGKTFFVSEQRKPLHRSTVNYVMQKFSEV